MAKQVRAFSLGAKEQSKEAEHSGAFLHSSQYVGETAVHASFIAFVSISWLTEKEYSYTSSGRKEPINSYLHRTRPILSQHSQNRFSSMRRLRLNLDSIG